MISSYKNIILQLPSVIVYYNYSATTMIIIYVYVILFIYCMLEDIILHEGD